MLKFLYRPIDNAILIYFRIIAGVLMSQELINGITIGKFHEYVVPKFHFSYMFFDWIKPWPYWGMVLHYSLTIFAGFAVAFNYHYRFFSVLLFLGHSLLFLFEQTEYINHAYLYCLISFWIMLLPLDKNRNSAPAWTLYILVFHMALAYFFGGIAKLNPDWLSGTPMNLFLAARKDHFLGLLYQAPWAPYAFSYAGIFFDLAIIPMMIFRPTRLIGFIFSILFHISNVIMFGLATFPWFSLLLTSMFFDSSWPRRVPVLRNFLPTKSDFPPTYRSNKLAVGVLSLYILLHLSLPFRQFLYTGATSWTEEGHMFSWRMMLRDKQGTLVMHVQNQKTKQFLQVDFAEFITQRQYQDIIGKPDMILQFAHFLRDHYQKLWRAKVSVYASSRVSLNGKPKREMIEQGTDLALKDRSLLSYDWIKL